MSAVRFALSTLLVCSLASSAAAGENGRTASQPQAGRTCACPDPFDTDVPAGIVWQGLTPAPDLPGLARLLAPLLWFSSDEPLILKRPGNPIPHSHPCDSPSDRPVVYYQATAIVLRGDERVEGTGETDPAFFDKVDHFVLKFFFYYDEDFGLSPHPHDLEAINVLVELDRTDEGCLRIRVTRVEGLAHGVDWYSNILRAERDIVFPVRVLVEEGKHASILDRNADGVYTPGYDVNARVNDAWGLRDVLGSSVLMGSGFSATMAKPREDPFQLLPPDDAPVCGRQRSVPVASAVENLGRYELRPATSVPSCNPPGPEPQLLLAMMRFHRFGREWPAEQHESDLAKVLSDPRNFFNVISAINLRLDSDALALSVQGPGIDLTEVWLVPRGHVGERGWAAEALITPSASRWADWYVAMGYERGLTTQALSEEPEQEVDVNGFASEAGVKFRFAVSGKARWALLGYHFGGVRLGIRANGFTRLRHPRLVVEIGAGVF